MSTTDVTPPTPRQIRWSEVGFPDPAFPDHKKNPQYYARTCGYNYYASSQRGNSRVNDRLGWKKCTVADLLDDRPTAEGEGGDG